MAIQLYKESGWVDTIRGLESFGIVPEIRAQGTISKGYSGDVHPVSLDYFLVHREPEPTKTTKTLPELLQCYGVAQSALKMLHISIPSPAMCFKTGRFKYGKKSGVLCSSDDNVVGKPLMDLKVSKDVTIYQGASQQCANCPFNKDGSCSETVLVLCTLNAPTDDAPAPFGNMLFKMTLPRTARNPFFGDYALSMELAFTTVLRYGLDHRHFPQAMIPFKVSLVLRSGQYYNEEKKSQVKTTYYVPQLSLDYDRLCQRLERFAEQFGGRQLYVAPEQKQLSVNYEGALAEHDTDGIEWTTEAKILRENVERRDEEEQKLSEVKSELHAPEMKAENKHEMPDLRPITQGQRTLLLRIVQSHVFTEGEALKVKAIAEDPNTTRSKYDEWLKWVKNESSVRHKAETASRKAQKQEEPEPENAAEMQMQQDLEYVREVLGTKEAEMFKQAILANDTDRMAELVQEARQQDMWQEANV